MTKNDKYKLDVFLCHASGDKDMVQSIYHKLLHERNIDPWLDQEKLLPGQKWDLEIRKAVSKSDVILVCLSKQSVNKEGYVQKEIRLALDVADEKLEGEIFLIPVKLEECEVPTRLSSWQWLNYFEKGAYERLLQSLQKRADHFGIKIGTQKSETKTLPSPIPPSDGKETHKDANKISSALNEKNLFILQYSMLKEQAARRKIKIISNSPVESQIDLFRDTLRKLDEYLDTGDLRKLTEKSLGIIRDDILEIIKGLRNLQGKLKLGYVRSLDGALEKLRLARDGLQLSLTMFSESGRINEAKSKKLFAELRSVRASIAEAIRMLTSY